MKVNGKMIKKREKVFIIILMEENSKAILKMDLQMEEGLNTMQMAIYMRVVSVKIKEKEKEFIIIVMGIFMMENGKMDFIMEEVIIILLTGIDLKVNIKMEMKMEKVFIIMLTEIERWEIILMGQK